MNPPEFLLLLDHGPQSLDSGTNDCIKTAL